MSAGREKQTLTSWNRNLLAKAREGGGRRVPVRGEKRKEEKSTQPCPHVCSTLQGAGFGEMLVMLPRD